MNTFLRFMAELAEEAGKFSGRQSQGPTYEGSVHSDAFFAKARSGDAAALHTMQQLGYHDAWKNPLFHGAAEREIRSGTAYTGLSRFTPRMPRGDLTGRPVYGYSRMVSNISGTPLKIMAGVGGAASVLSMATASRGRWPRLA